VPEVYQGLGGHVGVATGNRPPENGSCAVGIAQVSVQQLSQVDQRMGVPGLDGVLVGGLRPLIVFLPAQQVAQVHHRLDVPGCRLLPVERRQHLANGGF
jgi:hypothetical protein